MIKNRFLNLKEQFLNEEDINFFYIYVISNNINMNIYLVIKCFKTYIQ